MPRIKYVDHRFSADALAMIATCNAIIAEYQAQGFDLTLRQLYYQCVSRDLIRNNEREYKKLGSIINDARLAGLVDWDAITDRTRALKSVSHWDSPREIMRSAAQSFRIDKWQKQPVRVETWIEKDALVGVISGVCNELDVPYFSCRGYTSQSEMWSAGMRLAGYVAAGQDILILHLGDHDPSGRDMTRDITDRLSLFTYMDVTVDRLALNMDQIEEYSPPPNPAKVTDARAAAYIAEFGDESWELDALEPSVIADLIRTAVVATRDDELWDEAVQVEETHRTQLEMASRRWMQVVETLEAGHG